MSQVGTRKTSTQTWYRARVCVQLIVRQNDDLRLDLPNEKMHLFTSLFLSVSFLPLPPSLSLSLSLSLLIVIVNDSKSMLWKKVQEISLAIV